MKKLGGNKEDGATTGIELEMLVQKHNQIIFGVRNNPVPYSFILSLQVQNYLLRVHSIYVSYYHNA